MTEKVTLFNQVSGPLFIDIANALSEKYDQVTLVTGVLEPTYTNLSPKVEIKYFTKYNRTKALWRIYTWCLFHLQCFWFIKKNTNLGNVLFVTNPPTLPFLGAYFYKKRNLRYTVLVFDVYPNALSNFGYIKNDSWLYRYWESRNKIVYNRAEKVITISDVMKDVISFSANLEKLKVIYPWVDTSFIKPIAKNDNWFLEKYRIKDKKVILYSGNMGLTHDLMTVLKVAKEFNNMENEFHFLFIGGGAQAESLKAFKIKEGLKNVTFLPYQEPEVLPYSFASADFGIVTLGSGAEALSVPSKTFYLLASGAAIIAISETGSEISKLVTENKCGISVKPGDFKAIIEFLNYSKDRRLDKFKSNSRNLSSRFTKDNVKNFV